jgi:hypothetical protein
MTENYREEETFNLDRIHDSERAAPLDSIQIVCSTFWVSARVTLKPLKRPGMLFNQDK